MLSKLRTVTCAFALAAASLLGPTVAAAHAATLPPQGLYEECAPSNESQCATELGQMAGAGFKLVLNYTAWYASAAQIQAYAAQAQADGLKVIWPLDYSAWRDPGTDTSLLEEYPDLAATCNCTDNAGFLQYAVGLVSGQPATWGYYIGDELPAADEPAVSSLASTVRSLDAGHQLLYVGMGGANTQQVLAPFASVPNVLGADIYPIGQGVPDSWVSTVAKAVGSFLRPGQTQTAMVLQAFDWTEYPTELPDPVDPHFPTEAEMLQMRNDALAADPSLILWYSMKDIEQSSDPSGNWQDLATAAFAPLPTGSPAHASSANPGSPSGSGSTGDSGTGSTAHTASKHHRHHRRHHGTAHASRYAGHPRHRTQAQATAASDSGRASRAPRVAHWRLAGTLWAAWGAYTTG